MPAITASMVAELRAKTDAPMMECKKALTEADGDMARAEEILRVKLGSKAGKAASRVTAEGVVSSAVNGSTGALLEVNCETDFVSKNDSFLAFTKSCAQLVAEHNPADIAALGLQEGSRVDLVSEFGGHERRAKDFLVVPYSTPVGNAAAYYPETNPLIPLDHTARKSNTPVSKAVVIRLERWVG